MILFGSRARGDYRPDSDLDLMVADHHDTAWQAQRAARNFLVANTPNMEINLFKMTTEEFRRAGQHFVRQAAHHGVFMSNEKPERQNDGNERPEQ